MAETKAVDSKEAQPTHWTFTGGGMTLTGGRHATRGDVLARESMRDDVFEKAKRNGTIRPASPDEAVLTKVKLASNEKRNESYESKVAELTRENADLKAENLAQYRRIQQLIGEAEMRGPVVATTTTVATDTKPKAPVGGATDDGKLPTDFPHRAELVKVYGEGLSIVGVNALSDDDLAAVPGINTAAAIKRVRAAAKREDAGD